MSGGLTLPVILVAVAGILACLELAMAWWRRSSELRTLRRMWAASDA